MKTRGWCAENAMNPTLFRSLVDCWQRNAREAAGFAQRYCPTRIFDLRFKRAIFFSAMGGQQASGPFVGIGF